MLLTTGRLWAFEISPAPTLGSNFFVSSLKALYRTALSKTFEKSALAPYKKVWFRAAPAIKKLGSATLLYTLVTRWFHLLCQLVVFYPPC